MCFPSIFHLSGSRKKVRNARNLCLCAGPRSRVLVEAFDCVASLVSRNRWCDRFPASEPDLNLKIRSTTDSRLAWLGWLRSRLPSEPLAARCSCKLRSLFDLLSSPSSSVILLVEVSQQQKDFWTRCLPSFGGFGIGGHNELSDCKACCG